MNQSPEDLEHVRVEWARRKLLAFALALLLANASVIGGVTAYWLGHLWRGQETLIAQNAQLVATLVRWTKATEELEAATLDVHVQQARLAAQFESQEQKFKAMHGYFEEFRRGIRQRR